MISVSFFVWNKESMFPIDKSWEKQKIYLWETWKKHIMCFSDFSFRNTFCVSVGKTLWKSQNMSLNGFFHGKHHLAPAVPGDLTFQNPRLGQKPPQAKSLARLGLPVFGLAWPGLRPQVKASTSLFLKLRSHLGTGHQYQKIHWT